MWVPTERICANKYWLMLKIYKFTTSRVNSNGGWWFRIAEEVYLSQISNLHSQMIYWFQLWLLIASAIWYLVNYYWMNLAYFFLSFFLRFENLNPVYMMKLHINWAHICLLLNRKKKKEINIHRKLLFCLIVNCGFGCYLAVK